MISFRILTTLLVRNNLLVKGKQFINDRRIGSIIQAVNVFQQREIDELIIVDIDATKENRLINCDLIGDIVKHCFIPLGFGGGIKQIEDVEKIYDSGADKVIIGTNTDLKFIRTIADKIGSQSVCVSIDYSGNNVFTNSGKQQKDINIIDYVKQLEQSGVGEFILNNISKDGTLSGFDLTIAENIISNVKLPVVISGGAKDIDDFKRAYDIGASGVSAGALYQFTQITPKIIKNQLKQKGVKVRLL